MHAPLRFSARDETPIRRERSGGGDVKLTTGLELVAKERVLDSGDFCRHQGEGGDGVELHRC
jgi:hypothetical protein